MPAYHCRVPDNYSCASNLALLPLRTKRSGPAPIPVGEEPDVIDEALQYFKANVFFRTYEVKGDCDRTFIYATLYITECLKRLAKCKDKAQGATEMYTLAISRFPIPGEAGFPLNSVYAKPKNDQETELYQQYLLQLRHETGARLLERVFSEGKPSKWWLCFIRRRFMDKELVAAC